MEKFFNDIGCGKVHGGTITSFSKFIEEPNIISSSAMFGSIMGGGGGSKAKGGRVVLPKEYFNPKTGGRVVLPKEYFNPKPMKGGNNATTLPHEFFGAETTHYVDKPTMTDTSIGDTLARVGVFSGGATHKKVFSLKHFDNMIKCYQKKNNINVHPKLSKTEKTKILSLINQIFISTIFETIKNNNGKLSFSMFKANLKKKLN
jgi:hypothetical protein